ncbi:MAG: transcription-repair coupling factor [Sarcina sp.]
MRLDGMINQMISSIAFKNLNKCILDKEFPLEVNGLSDSGRAYFISSIFASDENSIVVVTGSDIEAKDLYEDLSFYTLDAYYLPTKEVVFYNIDAISGDLRWARLKVIKEILENKNKKIIVTSIESFVCLYTPIELYKKYSFKISEEEEVNINDIVQKLVESGYERVTVVEGKGEFAIRGGILDVYPPCNGLPCRIELFGDEVDSIRTFNTDSQRSIERIDSVNIFPAKEIILDEEILNEATKAIKDEFDAFAAKNADKKDIVEKLEGIVKRNLESLKETWSFEAIESYIPYLFEKPSTLFDYLKGYTFIIDEPDRCKGKIDSTLFEFVDSYKAFLERGDILPSQNKLLLEESKIEDEFLATDYMLMNSLEKNNKFLGAREKFYLKQTTLPKYQGNFELLLDEIRGKKELGYSTVILAGTRPRGERLVESLKDNDIECTYKDAIESLAQGEVVVTFGNQINGFDFSDLKLCVISDKEAFGEAKRKATKRNKKQKGMAKIKSFGELKPGDFVVHVNSGIGVYKGIKQIEVGGNKRDYLDIEYQKGDKLYVPVEQLDLVQKYVGSEGKSPKVNKLGGPEWQKAKAKARKSINDIAEDLVKLYAARKTVKGYKFAKDTHWQKQFEDEFPYEETPDQLTSLEEIKGDMESDKPMDRLLCGDVGYGKTEVAIRAAFKAVMEGKQVAFLVPTTILADQHYSTFKKRFASFPVNIDVISRFKTKKEQNATLKALAEGNVDILIGTHRLVSKDIGFKDLGLLIVDEEQRFGVTQKEKIKNVKKNVDVLTLSATPIPRTLHMSLTGVRDISVIETPPEDRYPIQTYVVEQNDQLIRDAILREINRGGQAFLVYNRVESIQVMAAYIKELIPECTPRVIHGQMSEKELEKELIDFMNKEANVLVCTSIIETGIDMPDVNTLIVYDSDRMGLSQLYQLRGRVGRSNRIAYAYFVYRKDKVLTEVAEKRLKALKDFTELGSGFKIAMRDLEIRGAGNMMGSSQHGHMASIGYDLYCRMLEDTIKLIKGEIENEPVETTVDIKFDAYIPSNYIENEIQKIEVYKKIAAIENEEDYNYVKEELEDRYSNIPKPVLNLMDIAYVKSKAKILEIEEVKERKNEVIFEFQSRERTDKKIFVELIKKHKKNVVISFGDKPSFIYRIQEDKKDNIIEEFKIMLDGLVKIKSKIKK